SPPKISVLTDSGRFSVKTCLSMSVSHYHRESWYIMPLSFLLISVTSAFPDYNMTGIGHYRANKDDVKERALKSREYNQQHYPELCQKFERIDKLKKTGTHEGIEEYILARM